MVDVWCYLTSKFASTGFYFLVLPFMSFDSLSKLCHILSRNRRVKNTKICKLSACSNLGIKEPSKIYRQSLQDNCTSIEKLLLEGTWTYPASLLTEDTSVCGGINFRAFQKFVQNNLDNMRSNCSAQLSLEFSLIISAQASDQTVTN